MNEPKPISRLPDERRWCCLDCGKNTFHDNADYYMLRNKLWRQAVPRHQRHGMLCLYCVSKRLGRPLQPEDFLRSAQNIDESDPDEAPMDLADYGIIDTLTPAMLEAIDQGLIRDVSPSNSRRVRSMIGRFMEHSAAAISGLPDYYYLMRIEQMVDSGVLVITEDSELLIKCKVRLA